MTTLSLVLPQIGQPDTTEDVKLINALTAIQGVINGNVDTSNLTAAISQSAGINASGQTVKGSAITSTSQSTGSTTFTTLATPDQVSGIVLPSNGLLNIWYQATWQESVFSAGQAAIFLNSNQLKVVNNVGAPSTPQVQSTTPGHNPAGGNVPLVTGPVGLVSFPREVTYGGDVTTGQILGSVGGAGSGSANGAYIVGASTYGLSSNASPVFATATGGPTAVFAAAGTYTVSVQFKASSGTVTVANRRLYVQAVSFA